MLLTSCASSQYHILPRNQTISQKGVRCGQTHEQDSGTREGSGWGMRGAKSRVEF